MRILALLALLLVAAPALAQEMKPQAAPVQETVAPAQAKKWEMIPNLSAITFKGKQMGSEFEGVIGKFTPEIYFDPDQLDHSKVTVDVDVSSIDAKDKERTSALKDPAWFDPARFPTARFETVTFTKTGENAYLADATLTIRGVAVPVQLPFTLTPQAVGFGQDRMLMQGAVTLDRSKFQLGQGDWADPSVIANEVTVAVKLVAAPAL